MTDKFSAYRRQWFGDASGIRQDVLAGIVVALALIPEAIGFSIIAGVDPRVGLYASVAIAIVIALIGGRPGMISAATAAVAVLREARQADLAEHDDLSCYRMGYVAGRRCMGSEGWRRPGRMRPSATRPLEADR